MRVWCATRLGIAAALAAATFASAAAAQSGRATQAGLLAWVDGFRAEARAAGLPASVIDRAFARVTLVPKALELDNKQPEFTTPIWVYLDRLVSANRVRDGRVAARRHAETLAAVEERFGVPASTVAAIWGVESNFGSNRGGFDIVNAMATLAYEGRRRAFWKEQLIAALRIMNNGDAGEGRLKGSWAGAMGHTQFIPTSYLQYAADFDGDGKRDIWADDPSDALASTANYLAEAGWRRGEPWGFPVRLPDEFDFRLLDQGRRSTDGWREVGLTLADGAPLPGGLDGAQLLVPAGANGPAFLTLANFRAIRRYNNAISYALAVALLAERIDGADAHSFNWPEQERPLSRSEARELQAGLTALGFDTGGVDGLLGEKSRRAIRRFQAANSMRSDGYASINLLGDVRKARGLEAEPSLVTIGGAGPSVADIREMQVLLLGLGYRIGTADGAFGRRTERAVKRFIASRNAAFAAEPSTQLLDELRRAARGE